MNYQTTKKFDEFYDLYPKKANRKKAAAIWNREGYEKIADTIIGDVRARSRRHEGWSQRRFIPAPDVYLNGMKWEDEIVEKEGASKPRPSSERQRSETVYSADYLAEIEALDSVDRWANRALLRIVQTRRGFNDGELQAALRVKADWVKGVKAIRDDPDCEDPTPDFEGFRAAVIRALMGA